MTGVVLDAHDCMYSEGYEIATHSTSLRVNSSLLAMTLNHAVQDDKVVMCMQGFGWMRGIVFIRRQIPPLRPSASSRNDDSAEVGFRINLGLVGFLCCGVTLCSVVAYRE